MATSPYENTIQNLELVLSGANLHFVGWVEPTPSFVGFLQRINLHIAGVIAKCETQQLPISELAVFFGQERTLVRKPSGISQSGSRRWSHHQRKWGPEQQQPEAAVALAFFRRYFIKPTSL
jgi:hypothetical protein